MEDQEVLDLLNFLKKRHNMKQLKKTEKFLWEENYQLSLQKKDSQDKGQKEGSKIIMEEDLIEY